MSKRVVIVTVNYNGRQDTLELLHSLKKLHTGGLEVKIIVVDNASTDGSVTEIQKQFSTDEVTILQTGENLGFTGGYNRGMRYSKAYGADYTLIINNDTLTPDKNLLKQLIETIESKDNIGLVSPKILFAPGFEYKVENKEKDGDSIIWYAGGHFDWDNVYSKHRGIDQIDRGQYDKVEPIDFVSGCCLLIKNEIFDTVGFFDESLFAYFDDNDYTQRIVKQGYKKYYNGLTFIYHKVSRTAGIGSPVTDYYLTRNRLYFGVKYASLRTKLALLREALKFLLIGRTAQKKGVIDFFGGKKGKLPHQSKDPEKIIFPKILSIVFVNYNTADLCVNLLKSIFKKESGFDPKTMEVIMLDDNSPTDPEPEIKPFLNRIQYFRNTINLRFTRSYNRVIHLSQGKYVLVLNSDIEVLENALTELIKVEQQLGDNAVLGGRLYFPDMRSQDSISYLPTVLGAIKEYFFKIKGAYFMYVPKPEKLTKVEVIVGACMFIPRTVFNTVGFFSEEFISYFEDIEFGRRFKKFNIPVYFVPTAKFIHVHGASFKQLEGKAYQMLVHSSKQYHGTLYYCLLYITLWFCQKFTSTRPGGEVK